MMLQRQESCPLMGTWKLRGMFKNLDGGGREPASGGWEDATGYLTYTPDGRMIGILSRSGKQPIGYPDIDDAKRIDAHKGLSPIPAYLISTTIT